MNKIISRTAVLFGCLLTFACSVSAAARSGQETEDQGQNGPAIEAVRVNTEEGTFEVRISGVENDKEIRRVMVPTWSLEGGQDDLIWYPAVRNSNGVYSVSVDIRDHAYSCGIYQSDVYITDMSGYQYFTGGIQTDMELQKGSFHIEKKEDGCLAYLTGVSVPGGVRNVYFPTWSEASGQDDIVWHQAKYRNGAYVCDISVSDHKGLGRYEVHAYVTLQNGRQVFLDKTTFELPQPSAGKLEVRNVSREAGTFRAVVSGVEHPEMIRTVYIPVWGNKEQKDIIWYPASRDENGEYFADVSVRNHNYICWDYNVHAYIEDITGQKTFIGKTTCRLSPEYGEISVSDRDGKESVYHIEVRGLDVPTKEAEVCFAVWGEKDGQNDIQWLDAKIDANGNYQCDLPVRGHGELGNYQVHVYARMANGFMQYVDARTFQVYNIPEIGEIRVTETDGHAGTFRVTVTGVKALSGVDKVQIPVWVLADQSDIRWYEATRQSEGVYTTVVNVTNHQYHFGKFNIHVYVTAGNGVFSYAGQTTAVMDAVNYVYSLYKNEYQREIVIKGLPDSVTKVRFPTWSVTAGQDDIVWYVGTKQPGGAWNAIVDTVNHNSAGVYDTHVYATSGGRESYVGQTSYSLEWKSRELRLMEAKANLYSSRTPYLILVDRNARTVTVFQGWQGNWRSIRRWSCTVGAPGTPTVTGVFRVGSRGYYFDSGIYRCYWWTQFYGDYLFHSVLYTHGGTLADGRLGMALSHGCVRLQIENAKWIYDTIPSGTTVVVY